MNLTKLKTWMYNERRKIRYKKFKNCSLPYPYWDEKRDTFEWVRYDKNRGYETQYELYEVLGDLAHTNLTYHYKSLSYFRYKEGNKEVYKITESHGHNFNEIVSRVYNYPETFEIPQEFLKEYSEQELRYLKKVQNYLKLMGLKDYKISEERDIIGKKWDAIYEKEKKSILDKIKKWYYEKTEQKLIKKENFARFEKTKAKKYMDCYDMHIEKESVLKAMVNGTNDYRIFRYCGSKIGRKYFLLDLDENYHALIEFTEEKQLPLKDLTEDMVNFKAYGDKSFKEYKEKLLEQFKEDDKLYEKEFTENTPVLYAKFKVIERF